VRINLINFFCFEVKVEKRWIELTRNSENEVLLVDLMKTSSRSLGLSLAGHKDRNKMAVVGTPEPEMLISFAQ